MPRIHTAKKSTKPDYRKTYWNGKGKHEDIKGKLQDLIPVFGEVSDANGNPALETFRRASNCYYDLYNNGLCNRAREFESIFDFRFDGKLTRDIVNKIESKMNRIIRAAAKEQGIT